MMGRLQTALVLLTHVFLWRFFDATRAEDCRFEADDKSECCVIPFEFNNKNYTECTADVASHDWKEQWRGPWCPVTRYSSKKEERLRCVRKDGTCGGIRTQAAGVISSSNFPYRYEDNENCVWNINVKSAGSIMLNFTDFELEPERRDAYVQIFDGDNVTDHVIATFYGNQTPIAVRSSGNKMLVVFRSRRGADKKGFRAYYDSGSCEVRSYGGNGGGACCVFPFTYKGNTYHSCTNQSANEFDFFGEPWCSVTDNYDRDRKRGLCVNEQVSCAEDEFTCKNNHWWKQCIPRTLHCDGKAQCADKSDENNCSKLLNPFNCEAFHVVKFSEDRNHLFQLGRSCDVLDRCGDNSSTTDPCRFDSWSKCRNGLCVPSYWLCDGKDDCGDRSDELLDKCPNQRESREGCAWTTHCSKKGWDASLGEGRPAEISTAALCNDRDLSVVPQYLPYSTTTLLLSKKNIRKIEQRTFKRYISLKELDLEDNKLRVLEGGTFREVPSLVSLKLRGNPIQRINTRAFEGLKILRELNLSEFEEGGLLTIEVGAFEGMDSLTHLYLTGNKHLSKLLRGLFQGVRSLLHLDLSDNNLGVLESEVFDGLSLLTTLILRDNPIKYVEAHAFYGLKSLQKLNLSGFEEGGLRTIEPGAFTGMDSLTHLYLAGNKHLATLPVDIFDDVRLLFLEADKFEFCCLAKLYGANCSAPKDLFSSCADLMANLTLRYCIWILGSIALFGNVLVLIWRGRTRSDSKVHSMLLFNLAVSDLLMGVYLVVIGSADVYYRGSYFVFTDQWKRSPLCQFSGFVSSLSCEASVLILTTMTSDRYVTIVHPFKDFGLKARGTRITLVLIWLVSFTLAVVPLVGIDYFADFYGRSGVCLPLHLTEEKPTGWEFSVFVYLVLNFSSFMVIFILYLIMFFKIKRTRQMTSSRSSISSIGKRMVFIVLTDFFCWVPIILIGIASLLGMEAPPDVYAWIAVFVLPLNSALNPVLYTISTANFRRKLRSSARKSTRMTSFLENSTKKQASFHMTVTDTSEKETNGNAKTAV